MNNSTIMIKPSILYWPNMLLLAETFNLELMCFQGYVLLRRSENFFIFGESHSLSPRSPGAWEQPGDNQSLLCSSTANALCARWQPWPARCWKQLGDNGSYFARRQRSWRRRVEAETILLNAQRRHAPVGWLQHAR